ncbi:MAG TPA: hypothetical protein DCL55_13045 [Brevundimonas sp.]|nr:hypothetical protein [Brevundimonas sp.]
MSEQSNQQPQWSRASALSAVIGFIVGGLACFVGILVLLFAEGSAKGIALAFFVPGFIVFPPLTRVFRQRLAFMRPTFVPPALAFGAWVVLMIIVTPLLPDVAGETMPGQASGSSRDLPPSREKVLAQVETLISEGTGASTTQAIVVLNDAFTPTELNTDPQLKPIMDRAKAAYEQASFEERAAAYAARLDGYWTEKLGEISTSPPSAPDEIWNRESVFADIARELEDGAEFKSNAAAARSMTNLRRALISKQATVFPVLRRGYGTLVGRAVWEQDVEIVVEGGGGRTIRFIAGMFAANRNIASAQQSALPHIQKLRFGRSQYEWYRGSRYQYYSLETPTDRAVGYWESGRFVEVD